MSADGEQLESQNLAELQSDGRVFGRQSGGFI
jgi:phage gp36-like protein